MAKVNAPRRARQLRKEHGKGKGLIRAIDSVDRERAPSRRGDLTHAHALAGRAGRLSWRGGFP